MSELSSTSRLWYIASTNETIDLSNRPLLHRIVEALADCRDADSAGRLSVEQLFTIAWRGERALPQAAANRVYVALSRLRRLGFADFVRTGRGGFFLASGIDRALSIDNVRPLRRGEDSGVVALSVLEETGS